ncbi:MAG: anaerobic ribonucleoside-triphosphate reductase activating protein [Muribaculaceae bacterium]|nr:anaerobic ribonucleoside-triphosphate reductase activating protein [Muribaculaceae bacterium]
MPIRVVAIVEGTSVDGPGLRTSVYFAGCEHHCPGCHNTHTWDTEAGVSMSVSEIIDKIKASGSRLVTFSGGDPMFQARLLVPLAQKLHAAGFDIWCYTGYTFESIMASERMMELMPYINVLVDGPYVSALRDTRNLLFRGSSNQRLIDVSRSLAEGKAVDWIPDVSPDFSE